MVWGLAAFVLLLSLALLALGLRGRRIGDAPHCRRCRFDLSGLADPDRCPECGRSLGTSHAVVTGGRQRRPIAIGTGLILLLVATALGALGVSGSRPAWNAHKPGWLLVLEATRLGGDTRDAAAAELLARHNTTPLTADHLAALVNPALDVQEDLAIDWAQSPWWRLLDAAFGAGVVDDRQLRRYVRGAHQTLSVRLPDAMLADASWPTAATSYQLQLAGPLRLVPAKDVAFVSSLISAELDGEALPLSRSGYEHRDRWRWLSNWTGHSVKPAAFGFSVHSYMTSSAPTEGESYRLDPWRTAPGPHTLRLTYAIEGYPMHQPPPAQAGDRPSPATRWTLTLEHPFEAFGSAEEMCRPLTRADRPEFDPDCTVSSRANGAPVRANADRGAAPGSVRVMLSINRGDRTLGGPWIVGRLEFRHQGRRFETHSAYGPRGAPPGPAFVALGPPDRGSQGMGVDVILPHLPRVDTIDLVIVPDLQEAARRGCSGDLWSEEIVIEAVPLDWSGVPEGDGGAGAAPPGD